MARLGLRFILSVVAALIALTCVGGTCHAGTHRADFGLGSCGGFSRGGWDENVERRHRQRDGRVGLGTWGWMFTCRHGQVIVSRIGRGKGLGACDLGTGLGGPWPRPLVSGGLFVKTPRPGFGPYTLPLTFEAKLADVSGFLAASSPADGRAKFLGVVAEVQTAGGVKLLCAGLKGTKDLKYGIYELPKYRVLSERPLPQWKGAVVVLARCAAGKFSVSFGDAKLEVPLDKAQNVRAIALRVAGVVGKTGPVERAVVVEEMAMSAPNVPDFPEKTEPTRTATGPFLGRRGTKLLLGEREFRAVGMNQIKLLYHFAGLDANPTFGEFVLESLAREGFTVLRVSCAEHVPHFNKRDKHYTMFRLFEKDPAAYFAAFDRMLAAAKKAGVRLVPVLIWSPSNIADHLGTSSYGKPDFAAIRRTYLDRSSREHKFLKRYLESLAKRYRQDGTILCWEIGNEWQNSMPKTARYYRYNPNNETPNPYVPRWKQRFEDTAGMDAREQVRSAQAVCAGILKAVDSNHLVLSAPESVSVHFAPDNSAYRAVMRKMMPPEVDLVGYHQYANSAGTRPMKPWGYSPFLTRKGLGPWDAHVEVIREVAAGMHGGRPVVIGETNVHYDRRAEMRATRLGNLRNLFMAAANVSVDGERVKSAGPARISMVLGWKWVPRPDLVDGYSLYPKSCRGLYGRPDLDPFVEKRLDVFRRLLRWYSRR